MKISNRLTLALVLVLTFSLSAPAMSVRQFEAQPRAEQTQFVLTAVRKIIADIAKVNPALSTAVHDYFFVTPAGQKEPIGPSVFAAELGAIENRADKGEYDLDKVQIEGILAYVIKTDVMKKQAAAGKEAGEKK